APRDITPGLDFAEAIIDGIKSSKVFVLVYSSNSNKSTQVIREVDRAVHNGLPVINLRIEDVPLSKQLEYYLSSVHWLDAVNPPLEEHINKLSGVVKILLRKDEAKDDDLEKAIQDGTLQLGKGSRSIAAAGKSHWKKTILPLAGLGVILLATLLIVTPLLKRKLSTEATAMNKSIAVLPFDNLSGDPEQEYFSDGMMDEILDRLFKIGDLKVISRTSSMRYKNSDLSLKEIAGELGVSAILEGSVRRAGNLVRITIQLIDAGTDAQLWSETYDGDLSNLSRIFIIQSEVAQSVARELKAVISPQEIKLIEKIPAIDLAVYDEYLKARSYMSYVTKESLFKSVEYLNSAIEKNPDWAPLYAGLADVWIWMQQAGWELPSVAGPIIMENLNKAMELDPDLAEVHYQSAVIAQLVEWDWEKSEKEFLKALAINPNNPLARLMYAQLLLILDRRDESLAQRELAISLDPLNPNTRLLYIGTLVQAGECKASLSLMEKALVVNPEDLNINGMLELAAYKCKDYAKVITSLKYSLPFPFEEDKYKVIERIYRESGIVSAYEELIKYLERYAEKNYIGFFDMAFRYIVANQPDKAMDWIEKGFELHDPIMTYITKSAQIFDSLFGNPRFIAICEKMNLPLPKSR
ncbi:MAG: TIR domain-containing protein, partial [Candidatus Atribacteria bacterium]